ncbi:MAG: helix-turn-helix transcriptional regulator [Clostridia bacterium]|nr:helix-turn-helix transcriptional regulator [Clostridia bacterium]
MSIGTTIKKLRRNKGITQEQLAEYLGISASAVSQWESEKSCPDIYQLPILANVFDVTTDEILEVDIRNNEEKIKSIEAEAWELSNKGLKDEAMNVLNEGIHKFPNSHKLMMALADITFCAAFRCGSDKEAMMSKSLSLSKKVLDESTDIELKARAVSTCVDVYMRLGNGMEAERHAMMLPVMSRNDLLCQIYKGDRLAEHYKKFMVHEQLTNGLYYAECLADLNGDDGRALYTDGEKIKIYQKILDVYAIIFEDGDLDFFYQFPASVHSSLACFYAGENNREKTVYHKTESVKYGILFEIYDWEHEKTSLLFRGVKDGGWVKSSPNAPSSVIIQLAEEFDAPKYDFIRDDERFRKAMSDLRGYINK